MCPSSLLPLWGGSRAVRGKFAGSSQSESHRAASLARREFSQGMMRLGGHKAAYILYFKYIVPIMH